jgi:hypothetical protein
MLPSDINFVALELRDSLLAEQFMPRKLFLLQFLKSFHECVMDGKAFLKPAREM